MKIALIGTRGVPARYGGFETCVEEVGRRLVAAGHEVRVYCRPSGMFEHEAAPLPEYLGMQLIHLPVVRKRSVETLGSHRAVGAAPFAGGADAAVVFNSANSPLLPVLKARRIPVATHVDGLEWRRGKWGPTGQRYYRAAEALAVRWSDVLIADAQGIQDYYTDEFGAPTELIAYGAPILTDMGVGQDRRVRGAARGLPPGGGALRAGEPRARDRPGLSKQRRRAAAASSSARRRTPTSTPPACARPPTAGSSCWARCGTRIRSTSCTRTR